jgi:excisionase family DNA binding protein
LLFYPALTDFGLILWRIQHGSLLFNPFKENTMQLSLSIEEACAATGLGRTKVYAAISSGALPAKKYCKRTLILKADLEAFLSGLKPYSAKQEG